ncbi:hypothetical protein Vadar_018414 [Vaccinium darrowii]|uniref:Uncharacterized protein n=1 Tax=Vaccinium darrowii TaxID=229202 RepID=A0ACB7XSJ6_9ERIC|nr:hypothetical protein Vadar_018414 [Vaccinium darrowii]
MGERWRSNRFGDCYGKRRWINGGSNYESWRWENWRFKNGESNQSKKFWGSKIGNQKIFKTETIKKWNNVTRNKPFQRWITLFIDNIPENEDKEGLRRLFSKYGFVKEATILEKRSKHGSRYGFVKYDCPIAAEMAILKANGLCVGQNGSQKLLVKRAKFGGEKGQIQVSVGEVQYKVRIEEEESFRTILSSTQPSMQGPQSATEDDDVDYGKDIRDTNKTIDSPIRNQQVERDVQLENKKDDLESDENGDGNQNDILKDYNLPLRVEEELQIINVDNNVLLLEEQQYQVPRPGGTLALNGVDGIDGENSNEINGLESIVEDSEGPISLIRKIQDEVNNGCLIKNTQSIEGQKSKEDDLIVRDTESVDEELNAIDPISFGSKNNLRASQFKGIDL